MLERLAAAASRGVRVMVLVDAWGSWKTPEAFWSPLRAAGGRVRLFRPIRRGLLPFRDHRKLLLVDDAIAWLGGMNVADEYREGRRGEPPWRDFALFVEGPEAARLRRPFLRMWIRADRPLTVRALFPGLRTPGGSRPEARVRFITKRARGERKVRPAGAPRGDSRGRAPRGPGVLKGLYFKLTLLN